MSKAILTKYIPATNFKPSRIKAYDWDKNSITIAYNSDLDGEDAHKKAACALRDKMQWKGELIGGGIKNGYAFVFVK